jgi:hypothetical protein
MPPRKANRGGVVESDCIKTLDLTLNADLREISHPLESAMKEDIIRDVRSACLAFLTSASKFRRIAVRDSSCIPVVRSTASVISNERSVNRCQEKLSCLPQAQVPLFVAI